MTNEESWKGAFDPCAESPVTRRFVEGLLGPSRSFRSWIHPADEMYLYSLSSLKGSRPCAATLYYSKGWQIFQTVRNVAGWHFGGLAEVDSLLDFAGGHGRVTRFLIGELDPGRICISEIHADAVAFQREYFGVEGLLSASGPLDFSCGRRFAFVVASSFFSHLPRVSFQEWMATLLRCVDRQGVFLFSTLGTELLSDEPRERPDEVLFLQESETNRLDKEAYGTTYVTEGFVRETVRQVAKESWAVARFPRGLCGLQDVYVVAARDAGSAADFQPTFFPWGDVDLYQLRADGTLRIAGWVNTLEQAPPVRKVGFLVNHRLVALCDPEPLGRAAFRWSFKADSRRIEPDDVLMINAVTTEKLENIVALGTLRTHPPEGA